MLPLIVSGCIWTIPTVDPLPKRNVHNIQRQNWPKLPKNADSLQLIQTRGINGKVGPNPIFFFKVRRGLRIQMKEEK